MEKYRFNKEEHLHQIEINGEWKDLTGCTTVLSVIAKPALISWAANMVVKYIIENAPFTKEGYLIDESLLEEARKAHTKRKEKAGGYGKETHKKIEEIITDAIKNNNGLIQSIETNEKSIKNFIDWAIKNKVKFLESEKNIFSEKLFIGGIVDFVCEIEEQIWIGDIKTSGSGIWPDNFWQCAGYHLMLKEMELYPNITGYLILNLKENGEILEKRSISNEDNIKAFLACLDIYRIQEKLKKQII